MAASPSRIGRAEAKITGEQVVAKRLTLWILAAMVLGAATGAIINSSIADTDRLKEIAGNFKIVTDIFLRLIKMIIAPLVFSTLVVGIAHTGEGKAVGRIGAKTMAWFIGASLISIALGLIMVNLLKPGVGSGLTLPDAQADVAIKATAINLKDFITHIFPKSIIDAMANNEILQIVVFSVFFGIALGAVGERGHGLLRAMEQLVEVMLKLTGYVMNFAPLAVFAAIAAVVSTQGLGALLVYAELLIDFYVALALLWMVLIAAGFFVLGPRVLRLISLIREPIMLAFSTASSESAYPQTMRRLEQFGAPKKIVSFVLPLGYSFNLDGSMMYCSFGIIFIAQVYGIDLTIAQELTMLGLLMITSKGMAAVPRASLVVIAAALPVFNIPETGLLLLLAIDQFLDMGRTATNVVGNSIATAVVAKWEGELGPEKTEG
jgi:Na+/H+-dicarboxylate symporter